MINKFKAIISGFNKSKDRKAVASNFGYLVLLQIAGYIFPLITIPYLARVIGVEGFGKIAFAAAVIVWFQTVADWGFNYTATRDIARSRDDPKKVSEIFSNVLWARVLLMILSFIILMIAIKSIPYFKENQAILLVTFLLIPGYILFPEWFFQAMEKMKFITIFNLASKALFTGLVFIFIKEKSDFILQPLFTTLGYALSGLVSMYIIVFKWKVKILPPKLTSIYSTIKGSTDVFINNIMPNLYNSLAVVLLGYWWGSFANGIYDAGRKLILIVNSFMDIFIRVTFPLLSRKISGHNLFVRVYLSISLLASLSVYIVAPLFIEWLFTTEFNDAITVMRISSISIFLLALNKVYGINYLIIEGYERSLRNITFVSALVGFMLSLPLVYFYSFKGAAITLVTTQGLMGLLTMRKAIKVKRNANKPAELYGV